MNLANVIDYLLRTTDQTHRFWGYYQVVTAAAVGFAWSPAASSKEIIYWLMAAYIIFAIGNCILVSTSQSTAREIWGAMQEYKKEQKESIDSKFLSLIELNKPWSPKFVAGTHVALSVAAVVAMYLSLCPSGYP